MPLKLYYSKTSSASRASLLTIRALEIDVDLVPINLVTQEHLKTQYLRINPLHTVPTLEDDEFRLWDSHVINAYLVEKYGNDDSLYPKDLVKRAVVDQRLHFDSNVLAARLQDLTRAILHHGVKTIAKDKADPLVQGMTLLETLFETTKSKFVAGNSLTIADFSLVTTVTTINVVLPLASNRFPHIFNWLGRMETLPYYNEVNREGLEEFAALIKSKNIVRQNSAK